MKRILISLLILSFFIHSACYASWLSLIISCIEKGNMIGGNILESQIEALGVNKDILSSEKEVENLIKIMNGNLMGHAGWGTFNFHDYQSYGDAAGDWTQVLQMAEQNGGVGALGKTMQKIANQFPIDKNAFNKGISDPNTQKYYALQAETILATRAASQLDYDKIQDQIAYQQMLQQQIEKTKDLKGAVDLNNRIQVEANLINLEILRQSALANQQHAIADQANINSELLNAKFLSKP